MSEELIATCTTTIDRLQARQADGPEYMWQYWQDRILQLATWRFDLRRDAKLADHLAPRINSAVAEWGR